MLLEKGGRTFLQDRQLGSSLSAIAGAINAFSFLSVGYYCANMTGNVSALATNFLNEEMKVALVSAGLVVCFLVGAMLSAIMVNVGRRRGEAGIYAYSILIEAVILGALALIQMFYVLPSVQNVFFPLVLSFLMGMQNATVTRVSGAVVRTTHVTGMLTDLGIEVANWLETGRKRTQAEQHIKMRQRLWLHSQIILCFIAGSAVGAWGYLHWQKGFLLGIAGILGCLAVPGILVNTGSEKRREADGESRGQ